MLPRREDVEASGKPVFLLSKASQSRSDLQTAIGTAMKNLETVPAQVLVVNEEIGKGRFKRVHAGRHKRRDVVILKYSKDTEAQELKILAHLAKNGANAHVPEIYGVCYERQSTSVIQEIAIFGSLKGMIKNQTDQELAVTHKLMCCSQIAGGMAFLESEHVVHADLSCRNVLVTKFEAQPPRIVAKITDFGLSVIVPEGSDREIKKQPQATRWCAPETIVSSVLSHKADVWSLGTTMWELFADGVAPWEKREKRADVSARLRDLAETGGVAEGGHDMTADFPVVGECPQNAYEAMLWCFRIDEYDRPTFSKLEDMLNKCAKGEAIDAVLVGDGKAPAEVSPTATTRDATPTLTRDVGTGSGLSPRAELSPRQGRAPWQYEGCQSSPRGDALGGRFKALKAFLKSDAAQVISENTLGDIKRELDEAEAREAYLLDMVRRIQVTRSSPEHSQEELPRYRGFELTPHRQNVQTLLPHSSACSASPLPRFRTSSAVASRGVSPGPRLSSGFCSRDILVPVGSMGEPPRAMAPPALGMWTLWSFLGSALRRQDFNCEAEAITAFENEAQVGPCMLRDPSGAEAAARSWVASYYDHTGVAAGPQLPIGLAAIASGVLSASNVSLACPGAVSPCQQSRGSYGPYDQPMPTAARGVSMSPLRIHSAPQNAWHA